MRNLIFITSCIFLLSCSPSSEKKELRIKVSQLIELKNEQNTISIANPHDFPVKFNLKVNNLFPLSKQDILNLSQELAFKNNIQLEQASWKYISDITFHSEPFSTENWQHESCLFINSIGGGFCDDRSSVLAKTWREQGFKSRIIGFEDHVVAEVLVKNKWQMYDPDFGVFYCDEKGTLKSIQDLESIKNIWELTCENVGINPILQKSNPISNKLSKMFSIQKDKKDVTKWHLAAPKISDEFILPANSSLEIVYDPETGVTNLRVILNSNSIGKLQIPLVPISAAGEFTLSTADTSYHTSAKPYLFPRNKFMNQMEIKDVKNTAIINYLVNPKLKFMEQQNKIEISTTDSLRLKSSKSHHKAAILFGKEYLFFQNKEIEYESFLREIAEYNGEAIDESFILSKFKLFLNLESELTLEQKIDLKKQFEIDLKNIDVIKKHHKILKEEYPKSVFYLIISSKYKKMDLLKSLIQ